jgi:membrane fusion protein, multidrug efflux system
MKHSVSRSLPQIIIIIVIVAVGASIVFNQLGISFSGKPSSTSKGSSSQGGASSGQQPKGEAQGQSAKAGNGGKRTVAVRSNTIKTGSLSNYTKIHGDAVSNNETKIYPNVGGKLLQRQVSVGDRVLKGTIIALVDPSKVGENYMPNPVESTVPGTILSIPVHEGDTITANTVIATVGNLSRTKISAAVPERYLTNLKIGTPAEISFDAIPGMTFPARVTEMSPIVDTPSRTLEVKLELGKADPRILVGMFATVKLATESRNNVIVTPRSSVILSSTESYVFIIKGDNTVERRSLALGLEGEDSFEVKKGLAPGDVVVTEGKGSIVDGDSVKIVADEGKTEAGAAR